MLSQPWHVRNIGTGTSTSNQFANPFSFNDWDGFEVNVRGRCATALTVKNLKIVRETAPGSGVTATYTFMKNTVAQAVTCSIADTNTEASDTVNSVAFAAGDRIAIRCSIAGGTPAASVIHLSYDMEIAGDAVSHYGAMHGQSPSTTVETWFNPLGFRNTGNNSSLSSITPESFVWPVAGTITALKIDLEVAPGVGDSYIFQFYKNEVKQDGAGGTVDTRATVSGTGTEANSSFSLPVAVGDRIALSSTPTGTPTVAGFPGTCFVFVADTDGYFCAGGSSCTDSTLSTSTNEFSGQGGANLNALWENTESAERNIGGITTFQILGLVTYAGAANDGRVVAVRRNGADEGPTLTFSGGGVAFSAAGTVSIANGDFWAVRTVGTSNPVVHYGLGGFIGSALTPGPLTSSMILRQALIHGGMVQ